MHLGWILKAARGRWNTRRPRLPCLYTSLTPRGAIAEFEKHLAEYGAPRRRDLVSIDVGVGPVLDLTSPRIVRRLGLDPAALIGDDPGDLAACRAIARGHVLHGPYRAILAPSASLPGAVNLMLGRWASIVAAAGSLSRGCRVWILGNLSREPDMPHQSNENPCARTHGSTILSLQ